jgi:hypothetical protein
MLQVKTWDTGKRQTKRWSHVNRENSCAARKLCEIPVACLGACAGEDLGGASPTADQSPRRSLETDVVIWVGHSSFWLPRVAVSWLSEVTTPPRGYQGKECNLFHDHRMQFSVAVPTADILTVDLHMLSCSPYHITWVFFPCNFLILLPMWNVFPFRWEPNFKIKN